MSYKNRRTLLGFGIIVLGFLFLLDVQGIIEIGKLWPLIIVVVGLWLIIKSPVQMNSDDRNKSGFGDHSFVSDSANVIQSNTFGDIKVTIQSKDFKSGQINTTFGDVQVDLTDLEITSGEQTLYLSTVFGDIKISAPQHLAFSIEGDNTAGDMKIFNEKRSGWKQYATYQSNNFSTADKKLKIITSQIFGDLKVW
jgi:lia operon protein LiaF